VAGHVALMPDAHGDRATLQGPVDQLCQVTARPAAVAGHRWAAEPGRDDERLAHEIER
jgi:hypothetical protein